MTIKEVPIGGRIVIGSYMGQDLVWRKVSDQQDLISETAPRVACFDQSEYRNSNRSRARRGNNFFPQSNIFQWLNAAGNDWYHPTHEYDERPYYGLDSGLLTEFMKAELDALEDREITIVVPLGSRKQFGHRYVMSCKVCLPSASEIGFNDDEMADEGINLPAIREMADTAIRGMSMLTRSGINDAGHVLQYNYHACCTISAAQASEIHPMIRLKEDTELIEHDGILCIQTIDDHFQDEFLKILTA